MRALYTAALVTTTLLLVSCGANDANLQDAAAELEVPPGFLEVSAETLDGFEATTRRLTFSTELSQADACDVAKDALAEWAQQAAPEPTAALPRNLCSYELSNPTNYPNVDLAVARVYRAKVGDEFIEDANAPGGVDEITIFFRINK